MGTYVNPSCDGFARALKRERYVDKTGLVSYINSTLDTEACESCVTMPRRFGKTTMSDMLTAYDSTGCDSRKLFAKLAIAKDPGFEANLNKCPVISFSLMDFLPSLKVQIGSIETAVTYMASILADELRQEYPGAGIEDGVTLQDALVTVSKHLDKRAETEEGISRTRFIIIDEWT